MSVGIIAEYNPFHNGHIYQLKKAKEFFPNEKIIIFMSKKYVQRGEIAICSYHYRKKMALKYGVHKVVPLPFHISTQAAHIFANGSVMLAHKYGVNKLFFGSESDNPQMLMELANSLFKHQEAYNQNIKIFLKEGLSFPSASAKALEAVTNKSITLPNDILGLEYAKAIIFNKLPIKIFTLKRTCDFKSETPSNNFASATLIRKMIKENKDVSKYTPIKVKKYKSIENYYPKFQKIVRKKSVEQLRKIKLMSEGMEYLFKKHIDLSTYDEFVNATNSKRYTSSRIKRVMLYVLLNIKK